MANRYWVAGTGTNYWTDAGTANWSASSGGAGGASVPTSADDVFFDANSSNFLGWLGGTRIAKSINCTGYTGGNFGGSGALQLSGNLTYSSTMTLTGETSITFLASATITTQNLVPTLSRARSITVNGSGITVTLNGNWTTAAITGSFTVTNGTLIVNSTTVTMGSIRLDSGGTRSISLNSATVNLGAATAINASGATSFNAGTSQINCSAASPTISGVSTLYNVSFTNTAIGTATINTVTSLNNLTFAQKTTNALSIISFDSSSLTITGTLTINSGQTDPSRRYQFFSPSFGSAFSLSANAVSASSVDFRDIAASGAASWNDSSRAGYLGDCKGNSGISFAAGRSAFWNLAGAQNWGATGWALTSTGTPAVANFPLAQDTATFTDAGSVTGTISMNLTVPIGSVDMSGRTSAMTLAIGTSSKVVYGNWTNGSGTTLSGGSGVTLDFSGRNTQTITSAGKSFASTIMTVRSPGGTVQLADAFVHTGVNSVFEVSQGTFNANNYNVTLVTFRSISSDVRTITMGSGTWTLTGSGTVWWVLNTANLTFNKNTANIVLTDTTTLLRTFIGAGLTYNDLVIGGSTGTSILYIAGSNTFNTLSSTKTVAHTIRFSEFTTNTFTNFDVDGTLGNVVTIASGNAIGSGDSSNQHTIAKAGGGTVTANYLAIQDSIATPDLTWLAINSADNGDNSGWYFGSLPATSTGNFFLFF